MNGTARRHRTLEEWQKIQAEMRQSPEPTPPEGYMQVKVDGVYHQAPTVEWLRKLGYRVIIQHKRYPLKKHWRTPSALGRLGITTKSPIKAKGGATHVILLGPEHGGWSEGHSVCVAKDPYSKKIGYVLAVNKALQEVSK